MTLKIVLAAAILFFAGVVPYQGRIIANQDAVIRMYMRNPCVPLTVPHVRHLT